MVYFLFLSINYYIIKSQYYYSSLTLTDKMTNNDYIS